MKKFLLALLIAIFSAALVGGVCACSSGLKSHIWSESWSHDISAHWHPCTDEGCYGRNESAPHDWVIDSVTTEPTCGDYGFGLYKCSVCGAYKEDRVAPTGEHEYELEFSINDATCHSEGNGIYLCKVCNHMARQTIPATEEHDFGDDGAEWQSNEEGHFKVCQNDGCTAHSEIIPHTEGAAVVTEPTNKNDGKREYFCEECGYLIRTEVITNPDVPVEISLTINFNYLKKELKSDGEIDGCDHYTIYVEDSIPASGEESNKRFSISFSGKNADGKPVQVSVPNMGDNGGIKVVSYDMITNEPTNIDSESEYGKDISCIAGILACTKEGDYMVVFSYISGLQSGERIVRAEKTVYFTAVRYNPNAA